MRKKILAQALAASIAGLFVSTAAVASDQLPAQPEVAETTQSLQIAFIDPVTKKLRAATPEEAADFAKKLNAERVLQLRRSGLAGRPRTDAEALKAARAITVNGYPMVYAETPETEVNYLVGMVDAKGNLVGAHLSDEAATGTATEVTK